MQDLQGVAHWPFGGEVMGKIVVPEGMIEAANAAISVEHPSTWRILEAALQWLSAGHMDLPLPLLVSVKDAVHGWSINETIVQEVLHGGLRRMFLASEPEVPAAISDLIFSGGDSIPNRHILEAYRRGRTSVDVDREEKFNKAYGTAR